MSLPMNCSIPPTPPPLPTNKISDKNTTKQNSDTIISSEEISSKTCSLYWNYLTEGLENIVMISLYNNVDSIIQNGPKCGLVALAMTQSLVSNNVSHLNQNDFYDIAKQLGFTNSGEMFSVENMAKLANKALSVRTEIKFNLKDKLYELLIHLAKGLPALVPYDSDGNHEPTLKSGQRAHWAIILGFCIAMNEKYLAIDDCVCVADQNNRQLFHLKPKQSLPKFLLDIINNRCYERVFIYAKQGKSKNLHIWNFDKLCQSNKNLVETSLKLNQSQIVLPESGGIIMGLNNQSLFINSQNCVSNDYNYDN